MLRQLIKHEFRATSRMVPFVYLITIVMALINYLTLRLGINWLFAVTMIFLVLLAVAEVIVTYVLVISRYYKNLYGSEGYLMHTLPVHSRNLLASKALVAFMWLVMSFAVLFGVVLVIFSAFAAENHQNLGQAINILIKSIGIWDIVSLPLAVTAIILYGLLSIIYLLAQVYFSITLGSSARFHNLGIAGPIVTFLITYIGMQFLALFSIVFIPFGVHFVLGSAGQLIELKLVGEGMLGMLLNPEKTSGVIGFGSIILMAAGTIGLFIATDRIMSKRTSLR